MDFNKMIGGKAIWEQYKNAVYCFEHTLEAAPHKTTAVRSLTSYLTDNSKKMSLTCWKSLKK